MELLFKDNIIGYIKDIYTEDYWIHGLFEKTDKFKNYSEFFKGIVCEDGFDESKFDSELLDDNNWSVNDNGKVQVFIFLLYMKMEIYHLNIGNLETSGLFQRFS